MGECSQTGSSRRQIEEETIRNERGNESDDDYEERPSNSTERTEEHHNEDDEFHSRKRYISDTQRQQRSSEEHGEVQSKKRRFQIREAMRRSREQDDEHEIQERRTRNRERMQRSREQDDEDDIEERRLRNRQRMQRSREEDDEDDIEQRRLRNRQRMQRSREEDDEDDIEQRRLWNRQRMQRSREEDDEDDIEQRRLQNRQRMRRSREEDDEDNIEQRRLRNRQRMRRSREEDDEDNIEQRRLQNRQRMRRSREEDDEDNIEQRRLQNRQRMRRSREEDDEDDIEQRRLQNRQRMRRSREEDDEDDIEQRRLQNRQRMRRSREEDDEDDIQQRRLQNRQRMQRSREQDDEDQLEERRFQNRERMQERRQEISRKRRVNRSVKFRCACEAESVMNGTKEVVHSDLNPLFQSVIINGLRKREPCGRKCEHCSAMLWMNEPKGLCCCNGSVELEPLFDTRNLCLNYMKRLCIGDSAEAVIYRKFARNINNAVSFASLQVQRVFPAHGNWIPAVVIQGKVAIQVGPILRTEKNNSAPPLFSQLYVLDEDGEEANHEMEFRMGNMLLSENVSDTEKRKLRELLELIVGKLKNLNPFVKDYKSAAEIIHEVGAKDIKLILDAEKRPDHQHARRFNTDFHEITVLFDDEHPKPSDVVLVARGDEEIQRVRDTNRCVDPLRFTLMFPEGTDGWHLNLFSRATLRNPKKITGRMFYSYHLMVRHPTEDFFSPVLHSGKLTQEYMCLNAAKIENQELFYLKQKSTQKKLRVETYKRLTDQISAHDVEVQRQLDEAANQQGGRGFEDPGLGKIGLPVLLPATHTGSPRYMHKHYQDAMAIVRKFGKPDLFITFTCNAKWPEITDSLEVGETANDRPDIVVRVFKEKMRSFLDDILKKGVLGKVIAHVYVIEFQKRGLPHAHILIIFDKESRIDRPEDVDKLISAEFPVPAECNEGVERERATELLELVKTHMVHSCSRRCIPDGHIGDQCLKHFPQDYCKETMWEKNGYYPHYRRRENEKYVVEMPSQKLVDNRSVVPYSPWLLMKYKAHINVEVCVSVRTVKYLYKYIHKGPDRMMCMPQLNSVEENRYRNDEIEKYQDMRSIGSSEACWRIFSFPITDRNPAVMALRLHLEDEQTVVVDEEAPEDVRATLEEQRETELTAFFKFNNANKDTAVKYCDFPTDHVWNKSEKHWQKRQKCNVIGRINTVHPTSGDVFYLRLLLNHDHSKGKKSFEELRTVNGQICESFRGACEGLGLLQNDGEWQYALEEAAETQTSSQIRDLFIIILMNCAPSDPKNLFELHWDHWTDDLRRNYTSASDEQIKIILLLNIEENLQLLGRELSDFGLEVPTEDERREIARLMKKQLRTKDSIIRQEELDFEVEPLKLDNASKYKMLNAEQKEIYDEVLDLITKGLNGRFFIDARGGTGKTFLLNTILSGVRTLRDEKNIALAVAYSGIAATLLSLGRTFHSRFKVPVELVDETVTFRVKANDSVWKVIKESKLIVWDEGPMSHRFLLEGLDRLLRDVMNTQELFGGKVLIISGDFRQVLPVIKRGSRAQVTRAALNQSKLWSDFKIRKLNENMRVGNNLELQEFANWLGCIGDGEVWPDREADWIEIVKSFCQYCQVSEIDDTNDDTIEKSLRTFFAEVFPNLHTYFHAENWPRWISERAILAPKNVEVDMINSYVISQIPGDEIVLTSADRTINPEDQTSFPPEFLNCQTPAGLPPSKLVLKIGMVLILLRNLNPRKGLCNGTRLILQKASRLLLECTLASQGNRASCMEKVLIPRIELTTDKGDFPIQWKRRQFPVRPAFAMTINKSQGQTFQCVGLWLKEPCFSHGQFYVACSRVGTPTGLYIAINKRDEGMTRNVVYKEALTGDN